MINNNINETMDKGRFMTLWDECTKHPQNGLASRVYDAIEIHYNEPARFYHTPKHINHCLRQLDLASAFHPVDICKQVEMALWFHDVIYDPLAGDNEQQSADWYLKYASGVMSEEFNQRIYELILITQHKEMPQEIAGQYLVDLDLSSFGQAWEEVVIDSDAVRAEYQHLSDQDFISGQKKFLSFLIGRPSIFSTEFFKSRYEAAARRNILRKLDELDHQIL